MPGFKSDRPEPRVMHIAVHIMYIMLNHMPLNRPGFSSAPIAF